MAAWGWVQVAMIFVIALMGFYITYLRVELVLLREHSVRDGLTGLLNRRGGEERLRTMAASRPLQPVWLMVIDIDHFKRINDTHGHAAGDAVLRMLARYVGRELRVDDAAIRWGGEELVVALAAIGAHDAWTVAERLREGVAEVTVYHEGAVIHITVSIGLTPVKVDNGPTARDSAAERVRLALEKADKALYSAKASGRNRVVVTD